MFVCPSHPGLRFLKDLQWYVYTILTFKFSLQWKSPRDENGNSALVCASPYCLYNEDVSVRPTIFGVLTCIPSTLCVLLLTPSALFIKILFLIPNHVTFNMCAKDFALGRRKFTPIPMTQERDRLAHPFLRLSKGVLREYTRIKRRGFGDKLGGERKNVLESGTWWNSTARAHEFTCPRFRLRISLEIQR